MTRLIVGLLGPVFLVGCTHTKPVLATTDPPALRLDNCGPTQWVDCLENDMDKDNIPDVLDACPGETPPLRFFEAKGGYIRFATDIRGIGCSDENVAREVLEGYLHIFRPKADPDAEYQHRLDMITVIHACLLKGPPFADCYAQ